MFLATIRLFKYIETMNPCDFVEFRDLSIWISKSLVLYDRKQIWIELNTGNPNKIIIGAYIYTYYKLYLQFVLRKLVYVVVNHIRVIWRNKTSKIWMNGGQTDLVHFGWTLAGMHSWLAWQCGLGTLTKGSRPLVTSL